MLAEKLLVMAGRAGKYKSVVMGCMPSSLAKMTTTSPAGIGGLAFWEVVAGLGKTGRNFAAGMSGGVAYVYDEDGQFNTRCNTAMVSMEKVLTVAEQEASIDVNIWHRDQSDEAQLKKLLEEHHRWTGSQRARELLDNWALARQKFVKVFPNEYKRALGEINARKAAATQAQAAVAASSI